MADKTVKNLYGEIGLDDMEKTSVTLVMYNKSEVKPVGKKRFKVVNPKNKKKYNIDFLIVTGACKSLLSLRVSEHLQLLTINKQNILAMDCNAVERALPLPAQRCFLRRRETGRTTTSGDWPDCTSGSTVNEEEGANGPKRAPKTGIGPVVQHRSDSKSWYSHFSAIVVTTNNNGKVRLCIDPKPLNQALHRNHYPLPTIDDVLPLLSKARVFTVLDAKNGFWYIQLDEPSSLASTFATPWGKISLAANAVWIVSSSGGISEANWCGYQGRRL